MTGAVDRMAVSLTVPFGRGADRLSLALTPGGTTSVAGVVPYDFAEHIARFEADPDPRYVVIACRDLAADTTIKVSYKILQPGGPATTGQAVLTMAAGTLAGMSAVLNLGPDEGAAVRLLTLTVDPAPATGAAADQFAVSALLGNLAKLLWVLGWERDSLSAQVDHGRGLRGIAAAVGQGLDLAGYDLGVPRFPPLAYAFETDTIALYHLEESAGVPVQDAMTLYGGPGHPSGSVTARPGAVGRFGRAFAFAAPSAEIVVADHADFSLDPASSFTAECFVKPDSGTWEGAVLSKHPDPTDATQPGWALSIGEFGRGIPCSARFLVSDGPHSVLLFADRTLAAGRFTHLAGVIDRQGQQARLYLDGVVAAAADFPAAMGALTNAAPVRIGRAAGGPASVFAGTVDEVRLSKTARAAFYPVLGEDDDGYRRRLRIFRRWMLPTLERLQEALNDVVGTIEGVAAPLVVRDANATLVDGSHPVTLLPTDLAPDQSIDDLGQQGITEAVASGTVADDIGFDPVLLADGSDARADFSPLPGTGQPVTPASGQPLLRVGARRALRALLDLLQAEAVAGRLQIRSGFDAAAPDLRQVGRAVIFAHSHLPPGPLAALAQRAGFSYLRHRGDRADVYGSVRFTDSVEITVVPGGGTATPENGFDLLTGQSLALAVDPPLPLDVEARWSTVACGEGRADLPDAAKLPSVAVTATHPGDLIIEVTVTRGARSSSAARRFRVGIGELAAGQSISDTGALGVDTTLADQPDDAFDASYLTDFADARITFPADPDTQRLQPVIAARLRALLDLLPAGPPRVTSGWEPSGSGAETTGRALTVEQGGSAASLARLGALAYAAGFSYVANDGARLRLLQAPGDLIAIAGPGTLDEGGSAGFSVLPRAAPAAATLAAGGLWVANSGTDTVSAIDPATGQVTGCVKVGIGPVAIVAEPGGTHVYTADAGGTTVTAVSAANPSVAGTAELSDSPVDLAHHPTASRLYVALGPTGAIAEVDTTTLAVARRLNLGAAPVAVAVDPGGTRLWVAAADGTLRPIDTQTLTVGAAIGLAGPAADVLVTATRAYVTIPLVRSLQVIDLATAAVQAAFTDLGPSPQRLALDPGGAVLYVTDGSDLRVYLRLPDGSAQAGTGLPASVQVVGVPAGLTADDRHAYVAAGTLATDNVSVLDTSAGGDLVGLWPLGTGLGERLLWSVRAAGGAQAELSSTTAPTVNLAAQAAGPALVRAVYQWPNRTPPYTFQVALNEQLTGMEAVGAPVVIRKNQYDLIMNVLNELHPVGVEVDTRIVRAHVLELGDSLQEAFPLYTYPDFRARGPRPPSVPIGLDQ